MSSKLYIRNARAKTRLNKLIRYYKEVVIIEYGYGQIEQKERISANNTTQHEEVQEVMQTRSLIMINRTLSLPKLIENICKMFPETISKLGFYIYILHLNIKIKYLYI